MRFQMFKKAPIPTALRNAVMAKNDCCVACGTWDAEECGHLISEINGGPMILENLVRMCGHCNRRLHDKNVAFKVYAPYATSPALITSRRAYWARYCGAANMKGIKPYRPI